MEFLWNEGLIVLLEPFGPVTPLTKLNLISFDIFMKHIWSRISSWISRFFVQDRSSSADSSVHEYEHVERGEERKEKEEVKNQEPKIKDQLAEVKDQEPEIKDQTMNVDEKVEEQTQKCDEHPKTEIKDQLEEKVEKTEEGKHEDKSEIKDHEQVEVIDVIEDVKDGDVKVR